MTRSARIQQKELIHKKVQEKELKQGMLVREASFRKLHYRLTTKPQTRRHTTVTGKDLKKLSYIFLYFLQS